MAGPSSTEHQVNKPPITVDDVVSVEAEKVEPQVENAFNAGNALEYEAVVAAAKAQLTETTAAGHESNQTLIHQYSRGDANWLSGSSDKLPLFARILTDHQNFYSPESLTLLGAGLVVGGAMANSSADQSLQHAAQSAVRNANSDDWFESLHGSKEVGDGVYTLPIFASAWAVGEVIPDSKIAKTSGLWGERSLRGFLVGAPPLIALQQLTGGSRPTETGENSEWHPFQDNNGISGHSFMGALPFITAAKMSDRPVFKAGFYAASTIAPLSRVNDNAHYPSQVALGWWMAYLAASAVQATDQPDTRWRFYPYASGQGTGILAEYKF